MSKQLLTHSRMQSFKACRKKAYFEYEVGLRREVDAKALRMGSAGHNALDVLKKGGSIETAIDAIRHEYANVPDGVEEREWGIEQETIECLVTGWNWRWGESLEIVDSEQSFALPLINPETGAATPLWDAAGKIDGIVQVDGRKLTLEHKFISDPIDQDSDYWRRLQIDSQISLYTWAGRQIDHDVTGVFFDVIRKPTIRPEQVPILDEDGKKIVLDAAGNRVFNVVKAKKKCEKCEGTGVLELVDEREFPGMQNPPCPCTQGAPRQTGDTEKGYVLQARQMTPEEWGEKLLADIGTRPEFYFARIEIARLDDELDEMLQEMWDVQKTIREAQLKGRWYKTVGKDTCPWCPFFGLCTSKFKFEGVAPEGFMLLENVHPEL